MHKTPFRIGVMPLLEPYLAMNNEGFRAKLISGGNSTFHSTNALNFISEVMYINQLRKVFKRKLHK